MPIPTEEDFRGTDRFAVQRRLGAGAFGVVYQAFDRERGTTVALKTLREANVESLYRLKREFRALADIAHPNLVTLHELLAHGDQWFFTMELVDGVDFLDYVRRGLESAPPRPDDPTSPIVREPNGIPMNEAEAGGSRSAGVEKAREPGSSRGEASRFVGRADRLRVALKQVVSGIRALHEAGKLHRDIKPSNVLVTREGRLVLLDFGLVTELGGPGSGASRSFVGTPAYMSPEQGTGVPVSEASDWYSLGVMLYEALTGNWPFSGTFVEMMWNKRHSDAAPPRELVPDIPEDLNALSRDLLRRDPQARPVGEEILSRLGGVQGATFEPVRQTAFPARSAPFVGREAHLSALRSAYLATREGRAVIVHLRGTSGMGKTALVRRFLTGLHEESAVVLAGRCYERESLPYKALDSLVDALSQYLKRLPPAEVNAILPRDVLALARLFPVLRRVEAVAAARRRVLEIPDSQELRRRAFAALRELLARLSDERDVVLFIDDLQWGDVDSAALLADLLRPPHPPALLLIACYRSEEAEMSPILQRLLSSQTGVESADVREVLVERLADSEARDLARRLLGEDPSTCSGESEAIARESAGNPFFIDELVRYSQAGVGFEEREAAEKPAPRAADRGTTLEQVIQARVRRLPEPARRLLEVLAVAGQPLETAVARHAAQVKDGAEPLALLRTRHLIRTRSAQERDEIEPYHDRIRETVVTNLQPDTLKMHHLRLALALEASGRGDPESLALHFQEAGDSERAAEYSSAAAARASEALAFYRAARLYRLALELRSSHGLERRELFVKLGDALSNAGHGAEAAKAYLDAVEGAPAADALELERRAAEQLLVSGHIEEGLSAIRTVLAKVGMKLARTRRGALLSMLFRRALVRLRGIRFRERDATQVSAERLTRIDVCWSAAKGLSLTDPLRGSGFQARQLLLALKAGEPYRVARSLAMEAGFSATSGGRARRRTENLLEAATSLANRIGHPHAIGFTLSVAGVAAWLEGRWKTARDLTQQAGVLLRDRCRGVAWELDNTNYYSLMSLLFLGKFRELAGTLPSLLKEALDRGDLYAATNMRTRISYVLYLTQDQPLQAREELRQAIESWSRHIFFVQHWYEMFGQVETALYSGEKAAAWQHLDSRWPELEQSLLLRVQSVLINSLYLRARTALAAAEDARAAAGLLQAADKAAKRIEHERMSWGGALAGLLRAGIASSRREVESSISLLESAERQLESADMALHVAAARRRRGEILGGDEGRMLVTAADSWMANQGIKNPGRMTAMLAPGIWTRL